MFVAKASPQQNGYIERFNGTMARELFGNEVYHSVLEVRHVVNEWTEKYNTRRAHRGLGGKTPAAYAKMYPDTVDPEVDGGCP
ncbi:integrase core domain-containing protein [Nocardioides montaniterrae]